MASLLSMMTCLHRCAHAAGPLVIAAAALSSVNTQGQTAPPSLAEQPADRPPGAGPAQAQATRSPDSPPIVNDERARIAGEKKAATAASAERAKRKADLFEQKKTTLRAEADYNNARLARALAEIAAAQYEEATFTQELAAIDGEIMLAESDLSRAEDRVEWARRMFDKGFGPPATKNAEELGLKKVRFTLEQVQAKRKFQVDYTKANMIKGLRSATEKARSDELAKMQIWVREKAKESELER